MKNSVNTKKIMDKKPKSKKGSEIKKNSGPKQAAVPNLKVDNFQLPASMLSQLNEFSGGGYILLRLDARRQPCVSYKFDTDADALALYSFGKTYINTVSEITDSNMESMIAGGQIINLDDLDMGEDEGDTLDQ
jgi:hypothetical protein